MVSLDWFAGRRQRAPTDTQRRKSAFGDGDLESAAGFCPDALLRSVIRSALPVHRLVSGPQNETALVANQLRRSVGYRATGSHVDRWMVVPEGTDEASVMWARTWVEQRN